MEPLIITAAIVGGELSRSDTPYLPITPEEIAAESIAVCKAGASIVHLHARDANGIPKHDPKIFQEIATRVADLAKASGMEAPILQFSTGGSIGMSLAERIAPLSLNPEMASLTTGSVNFGDGIFANDQATMEGIAAELKRRAIAPEIEIFDAGMIDNARRLQAKGLLPAKIHVNFVLGVPGGLSGDLENLAFLRSRLPRDASWSVAGVGRFQLPLAAHAVAAGGHVRVGLEDNIYFRKGELAKGNVPLVEMATQLARDLGRPVQSVAETRAWILQLRP